MKAMFLHGLESSSQGVKARALRPLGVVTPDFSGSLGERMQQLEPQLVGEDRWTLVGSSFGGLMAALWTLHNPHRVERLILLAPALHHPDFEVASPVSLPTLLVHGLQDEVVPPQLVRQRAQQAFTHLTVRWVEDDHRLQKTCQDLDWAGLLKGEVLW